MGEQERPTCWIIAGPNGAGKTTFALTYLPLVGCDTFVNADSIAAGISPLAPERERVSAARIFLAELDRHVQGRRNFGFETTLSGRKHLDRITSLKAAGWRVELVYLALPNVEMAKDRVAERVRQGGHDIPVADIERRFSRSLQSLFGDHAAIVDHVECFMNRSSAPEPVFTQNGETRDILDDVLFEELQTGARR